MKKQCFRFALVGCIILVMISTPPSSGRSQDKPPSNSDLEGMKDELKELSIDPSFKFNLDMNIRHLEAFKKEKNLLDEKLKLMSETN